MTKKVSCLDTSRPANPWQQVYGSSRQWDVYNENLMDR